MSWRISQIHIASRWSDSVSPLRLLSSFPVLIAAYKAGASGSRSSVVLSSFFSQRRVFAWIFAEEGGSFTLVPGF